MSVEFELLGPIAATVGGKPVALGHAKQQAVLVVLLVEANRVVRVDDLLERVWAARVPSTGRDTLYSYISRLRGALSQATGFALHRRSGGYLVEVDPARVDLHRFDRLLAAARAGGDDAVVLTIYDDAFALWRGTPFAELDTPWLATVRGRLEIDHLEAAIDRAELLLRRGVHAGLLSELTARADRYPLDERVARQLMLALYLGGRQADALEHYRRVRERLADELGVDPGPRLRELHEQVLRAAPQLTPAPVSGGDAVAQLPADPGGVTGRVDALARLDTLPDSGCMTAVVAGPAGVGKTTLAVHWAHQVRARFPDGQLYLGLRGHGAGPPIPPDQALARLLPALGVDAATIPDDTDTAAAMYRSALAHRRMLIVLDDAATAAQVRPLLPGTPGCLTVVTSRDRLDGLVVREGARRIDLDVLAPDAAVAVLAHVLGESRVATERAAAIDLVELCARLPLALRIAAATLLGRPAVSIAAYTATLRAGNRLTELAVPGDVDTAVRVAITSSYSGLSASARRVFRLLGLMPGADLPTEAIAALADRPVDADLRVLTSAHLVREHAPGRYTFHDLLRLYAAERAAAENSDHLAAQERLSRWYTATADRAADALDRDRLRLPNPEPLPDGPAFADATAAHAWFTAEAAILAAIAARAADGPTPWHAWHIGEAMKGYLLRTTAPQWAPVAEAGLRAAVRAGDVHGEIVSHNSLGVRAWQHGDFAAAAQRFRRALAMSAAARWAVGEVTASSNLGILHYCTGPLATATRHLVHAAQVGTASGVNLHRGTVLMNLGITQFGQGEIIAAIATLNRAHQVYLETYPRGVGMVLECLAECHLFLNQLDQADHYAAEAFRHTVGWALRHEQAAALRVCADIAVARGDLGTAHDLIRQAVPLAEGQHLFELDVTNSSGRIHFGLGDNAAATENHTSALTAARASGYVRAELEALQGLAVIALADGDLTTADNHIGTALRRADETGYRLHHARALNAAASAALLRGDATAALDHADKARATQHDCGAHLDLRHTLTLMKRARSLD